MAAAKDGVKSLARMAKEKLLHERCSSLSATTKSATFACGGYRAIKPNNDGSSGDRPPSTSTGQDPVNAITEPVQIRFGADGDGEGRMITFGDTGSPERDIKPLISVYAPASFGRGGEEVLYEDYHKADKLDSQDFSTNFCSYRTGIVDVFTQLLVPQLQSQHHQRSIPLPEADTKPSNQIACPSCSNPLENPPV